MTPGICACGCGGTTKRAVVNYRARGIAKGDYNRYISGHQSRRARRARPTITDATCDWRRVDSRLYRCAACHSESYEPSSVIALCGELAWMRAHDDGRGISARSLR